MDEQPRRWRSDARASLTFWAIAALFGAVLAGLYVATEPLLLTFAAVLFGVSLRGLAEWLAGKIHRGVGLSLALCIAAGIGLGVASALWIVPQVGEQFTALSDLVARQYQQFQASVARSEIGQRLLGGSGELGNPMGYLGRAAGLLASAFGAIGAAVFVAFVALYIAMSPDVYRRGFLRLVPPRHRAQLGLVLEEQARALRRWMLGRLVSMTAVGVATSVGLWILGIPLPVALGLIAGLLGFIPNIGPIISAVPALLLATTMGLPHVAYVAALYLAINVADGYLLTPSIEKRAVNLPPALVLVMQLVFGTLWGFLGLALATPLLASAVVAIRKLYVQDVLEADDRDHR